MPSFISSTVSSQTEKKCCLNAAHWRFNGSHLDLSWAFVTTAGNMDHKWPFIGLHEYPCSLSTGRVVGSGTTAMRTLHAAARCLLHSLLTVVTLLSEMQIKGVRAQESAEHLKQSSHTEEETESHSEVACNSTQTYSWTLAYIIPVTIFSFVCCHICCFLSFRRS